MSGGVTRTFAVEGAGEFPFDLLHRDRCWPASAEDARSLATRPDPRDPQTQRLRYIRLETNAGRPPHRALWQARGWRVID